MIKELFLPVFLLVLLICFIISIPIMRSKSKKKRIEEGIIYDIGGSHVSGLPIAENVGCYIKYCKDKIVITASGTEYNIPMNRITDICVKTETEIQQQYVSSAGGAVAGALMFGAVGAIIGGRAKKKETKTISQFLIITYMKGNEVKYVGFDVTMNVFNANRIVTHFKKTRPVNTPNRIEL